MDERFLSIASDQTANLCAVGPVRSTGYEESTGTVC